MWQLKTIEDCWFIRFARYCRTSSAAKPSTKKLLEERKELHAIVVFIPIKDLQSVEFLPLRFHTHTNQTLTLTDPPHTYSRTNSSSGLIYRTRSDKSVA